MYISEELRMLWWTKEKSALKPWYNKPRYSEFHDIVHKTQLPFDRFTKYITFDIVNYSIWWTKIVRWTCSLYQGLSVYSQSQINGSWKSLSQVLCQATFPSDPFFILLHKCWTKNDICQFYSSIYFFDMIIFHWIIITFTLFLYIP